MESNTETKTVTLSDKCGEDTRTSHETKQVVRASKLRFKKETKVVPTNMSTDHQHSSSVSDIDDAEERKLRRKKFLEEKKKLLRNRYPSSFAGKSDPALEHKGDSTGKITPMDESYVEFVPTFTTVKAKSFAKKLNIHIDTDNQKISDILANDNAKKFQELLKTKPMAQKTINRLLRTRLDSFVITRIMSLWYMLRKQNTDNVNIPKHSRKESFEYLYSVHNKNPEYLDETRKNVILTIDDPSWIWILTLKECWHPSMAEGIRERIHELGAKTVIDAITPVIREYHEDNRPYVSYNDQNCYDSSDPFRNKPTEITEIPSIWFRQLLYPLLGGEPRGIFNDEPMSHSEKLSTILSFN